MRIYSNNFNNSLSDIDRHIDTTNMDAVVEGFFPDLASLLKVNFPFLWPLISFSSDDIICSTPYLILSGTSFQPVIITHPFLGLSALGGIIIGMYYGLKLLRLYTLQREKRTPSSICYLFYSLSFLFFSGMNFGGVIFHCLQPPFVYLETIQNSVPSILAMTHIGHTIDVCSTCCSTLSFLLGRMHEIGWLHTSDPSIYYLLFFGIYLIGYIGLIPTSSDTLYVTTIPYTAELLYPGTVTLVLFVLPFCNWQVKNYPVLLISFAMLSLAFGLAVCERYLCLYLGSFFTAAGWCFFFSDLTFLSLTNLLDISQKYKKV